jgi:hypothetical protein
MTQYESFGTLGDEIDQRKTSGLAVASLICGLIFFCPITTIIAPLLGLAAIVSIGSNPARKGKGLALVGIVCGILFTAGWGYFGYQGVQLFSKYGAMVMSGPNDALKAGFAGDTVAFKASFHGPGATVPDDQALAFIQVLRSRYGEFVSCALDRTAGQPNQPPPGQTQMAMPYVFQFSNGTVKGQAELVFADPNTGQLLQHFGWIEINDPDLGDLRYPPEAPSP